MYRQTENSNGEPANSVDSGGKEDLPYTMFTHKACSLEALHSSPSHTRRAQSQLASKSSGIQLLGLPTAETEDTETKKTVTIGVRRILFIAAACAVLLVGVTALVLATLRMKGNLCPGETHCHRSGAEKSMRQEFSSLQKQLQELKTVLMPSGNSTTDIIPAVVNTSRIYGSCRTHRKQCTVDRAVVDSAELQYRMCATQRLRVNRDVSCIIIHCSAAVCVNRVNISGVNGLANVVFHYYV